VSLRPPIIWAATSRWRACRNGTAVHTIPDGWSRAAGGVLEAKNVNYQSMSRQLAAQIELAAQTGAPFNLVVSERTIISGPAKLAIDEHIKNFGGGIYSFDPRTQILRPR
jgi:filamentous hemagglutinin